MLPELYRAEAIAQEIVAEQERRLAKRQLLAALPPVQPVLMVAVHCGAAFIGERMIQAGGWLRKFGHNEGRSQTWTRRARAQGTNA